MLSLSHNAISLTISYMSIFHKKKHFRRFKLDIALAIPALYQWKLETKNRVGQGQVAITRQNNCAILY